MARPKPAEEMSPFGFRLPVQLIARVDAFATKGSQDFKVSRSDAIRVLLERALTAEGFPHADAKAPKRSKS